MASSGTETRYSSTRRRQQACKECHRRKVRCDVGSIGLPCTNCTSREAECNPMTRKKRARKNAQVASAASTVRNAPQSSLDDRDVPEPSYSLLPVVEADPLLAFEPIADIQIEPDEDDEARNVGALAAAVEEGPDGEFSSEAVVYSVGNPHGAVSFVANLVNNDDQPKTHYVFRQCSRKPKSPEDLEYLRIKGVFTVPCKEACDALIRTYFLHVHPLLPILDATSFLSHYHEYGYSNINLLLLWSMVIAAAQFEEHDIIQRAGYNSRKALKRVAFERAKLLYDHADDEDPLVLIQAVILLAHWHSDAEDRYEAWHWTGIAISLCQTAGLHCAPSAATKRLPQFTQWRERLCRRIWWTCVYRDRWLAMVKGRPLRIRLTDGDVAPAEPEDVDFDLRRLSRETKSAFFPYDTVQISHAWCRVVQCSVLLGDVLTKEVDPQYTDPAGPNRPNESDLSNCGWLEEKYSADLHPFERLCHLHNRLLYHATCIAFWRPYLGGRPNDTNTHQPSWSKHASERARTAAASSNTVLEEICNRDLLRYMKPQAISALVPAMQVHLMDCKSTMPSIRILGTTRLQLCLQVLVELRKTYTAAGFALELFQRAYKKVVSRSHRKDTMRAAANGQQSVSDTTTPLTFSNDVMPAVGLSPAWEEGSLSSWLSFEELSASDNFWNNLMEANESLLNPNFTYSNDPQNHE